MIDVPLSFCAWFLVLLIQVVVHFEVIYRRKANVEVTAEAHLIDSEDSAPPAKDERRPLAKYPDKNALKYIPPSGLTRVNSDPALDDTDTCDFDDEPPNLQQRLRQTGDEMMSVSTVLSGGGFWILDSSLSSPPTFLCSFTHLRAAGLWRTLSKSKFWLSKHKSTFHALIFLVQTWTAYQAECCFVSPTLLLCYSD